MSLKSVLIAITCAISAIVYTFITHNKIVDLRAENDRLRQNVWSLNNDKKYFAFRDSLKAVEMSALVLKNKELKQLRVEDAKVISELKSRPKDVVTITKTETITRDSVAYVYKDSCYQYSDRWVDIKLCIADSLFRYSFRDSVATYVIVDYQRKFLWWRWKPRYKAVATSFSPHCKVITGETILVR